MVGPGDKQHETGNWFSVERAHLFDGTDMKRPGVVVLLLTSAAAVQYHWQAAVSLHGPAVQTTSAFSAFHCGLFCEALKPGECSGFIYGADDGTCRLFSGDCRGPAADSSQLPTDRYLSRNKCPGENTISRVVVIFRSSDYPCSHPGEVFGQVWFRSRDVIFTKMTNQNQTDTSEMATPETK